ncbi:AraC family transcriptional regulator [Subtercola endophyticus]|uniref:AraC family transcriptional regulator n=1 Tax=Subtercola endophyticus TaxID=2895559 RepID=UPI001E454FD7|nr:AraC family transcriptional regulator [Subtercola endophyticus]UFS58598.1 AraC family transcriptional regulator [Subtercola endophyticus]
MPESQDEQFGPRLPVHVDASGRAGISALAWHSLIITEHPDAFRSTVTVAVYPSLSVTRILQTPVRVERSQQITDSIRVGTIFCFLRAGRLTAEQGGNTVRMSAGSLVVLSGYQPYVLTSETSVDMTQVLISRGNLVTFGAADYRGGVRELPRTTLARSTYQFLSTFTDDLPHPETATGTSSEQALRAMLAGILNDASETRTVTAAADVARSVHVTDYINTHSRDATLSPDTVAAALNVSLRQVQRDLASSNSTFTEKVRARRLRDAIDLLRDPSWAGTTLDVIAATTGFGTLSRMRRAFQAVHSSTPQSFRANIPPTGNAGISSPF